MAEKNTSKLTPFEKQQAEAAKQILGYKLGAEASIVSMIYKNPDLLRETNLELNDIHNDCWKVYFAIAFEEAAHYITDKVDEDGIWNALKHFGVL